jgi:hypothetical protein
MLLGIVLDVDDLTPDRQSDNYYGKSKMSAPPCAVADSKHPPGPCGGRHVRLVRVCSTCLFALAAARN